MVKRRQHKLMSPWPIAIVTLFLFVLYGFQQWRLDTLQSSPTTTQATVTELYLRPARNSKIAVVRYAYEVESRKYDAEDDVPTPFWQSLHIGGNVKVAYLADHPGTAMTIGYKPLENYSEAMAVNGILFVLVTGIALFKRILAKVLDDPYRPA